jgi:hypothetical protein
MLVPIHGGTAMVATVASETMSAATAYFAIADQCLTKAVVRIKRVLVVLRFYESGLTRASRP